MSTMIWQLRHRGSIHKIKGGFNVKELKTSVSLVFAFSMVGAAWFTPLAFAKPNASTNVLTKKHSHVFGPSIPIDDPTYCFGENELGQCVQFFGSADSCNNVNPCISSPPSTRAIELLNFDKTPASDFQQGSDQEWRGISEYDPGYVTAIPNIDIGVLENEIEARFSDDCIDTCIGYGYAIFRNGALVGGRGVGKARLGEYDLPDTDFTRYTRSDIASSSKTITALVVLRLLELIGLSPDTPIGPYLPSSWNPTMYAENLTFADVMSHNTCLGTTNPPGANPFERLQSAVEEPPVPPNPVPDDCKYSNFNYGLLRVLVTYLVYKDSEDTLAPLEADTELMHEITNAIGLYAAREYVFGPAGVSKQIDLKGWDESGDLSKLVKYYKLDNLGPGQSVNTDRGGFGPGSLFMNSVELAQIMSAANNGLIIGSDYLSAMKSRKLGLMRAERGQNVYYWHNGGTSTGNSSVHVWCPGNIQIAWLDNTKNTNFPGTPQTMMIDACEAALAHAEGSVVFGG